MAKPGLVKSICCAIFMKIVKKKNVVSDLLLEEGREGVKDIFLLNGSLTVVIPTVKSPRTDLLKTFFC